MAGSSSRIIRASATDSPADKLAAALAALGYARLRGSPEFTGHALYYDAAIVWFAALSEADQELCRALADIVAGPHKASAERLAGSLPPAPRCPL
jgi:hypothetical protein